MKKYAMTYLFLFVFFGFNSKIFAFDEIDIKLNSENQVVSKNQDHSSELLAGVVAKVVWDNTYGDYIESFAQSVFYAFLGGGDTHHKLPISFEFESGIYSTDLSLEYRF